MSGNGHRRTTIVGTAMLALLGTACQSPKATGPIAGDNALPPPPITADPPKPAPPLQRSFTVVATGDILVHTQVSRQARIDGNGHLDYRQVLGQIQPLIGGADLAICHLETPLAPARGPYTGYPTFSVPPQIAPALADLGYDTCSTASNHALDTGPAGLARTLEVLDRSGLRHAGTARSAAEAATPNILNVKGVPVAQLSYTYGVNGSARPTNKPWLANRIDPERILAAARRARRAGAQAVIVSLHWGKENQRAATPEQIALAQRLLAAKEIDLIVGHHVHVVQPFGRAINGKFVAYGMGNLVAAQDGPAQNEGLVARFTFTQVKGAWTVTRAEFVPTFIDHGPPLRVLNVPAALADPAQSPRRRTMLRGVLRRTLETVYSRGAYPILAR